MSKRMDERETDAEELERMRRRKARIKRMKREKERRLRLQRMVVRLIPVAVLALVLLIGGISLIVHGISAAQKPDEPAEDGISVAENSGDISGNDLAEEVSGGDVSEGDAIASAAKHTYTPYVSTERYSAQETSATAAPPSGMDSSNVIFLNKETDTILAAKDCHTVVNPASMTKVLTVLVAAEHITDMDDTFTMTVDITDYSFVNECSSVGFLVGETVTVRDLFYGTILPSGGDAAVGLATYVAGSHEAFVDMMNEKLKILGLDDTAHVTNCVGLYNADHHCTAYDMAMIMEAAMNNEICREVLSAHWYTTSSTEQHPDGITICNLFLRRIVDKETGCEVLCAKTGFVAQSGNCAVSYGTDAGGNEYICVTTGAHSAWKCIYDHVALYKQYAVASP